MTNLQSAKALVRDYYAAIDKNPLEAVQKYCARDAIWRGYHPFNEIHDPVEVAERFWIPLKNSVTRMQRRLDLFMAAENSLEHGGTWVASMGHLMGLFDHPWLDIPPTNKIVMLRYAEFMRVEGDKITDTAMFFDIPHLMMQAGLNPFPPQTGAQLVQPGPMTHDGVMFDEQDPEEGRKTLAAINFMIDDIRDWKGREEQGLLTELPRSWNDDMIWWGPSGIGATYTIERYAKQHAGPFRDGLTDRIFNGHIARIAEGSFGGFFGWPNLTLTPSGGFMGMPATGKSSDMRVIDMYRRSGDKLTENWIFIDLLHFWKQQGLDVLSRLPYMRG
ncbi:ester cyclase [Rhodobacteraceae bacterium B1Z28]|uniref:Ester cyclase n=1 Tax=Ruegeria haliotis TaxID=2747601 RepID=A0ABX2PUF3_9RHOB|nr:nuclear transport factor 2 family protein [Ruegeria haliotis]NVO57805.1 ester cyclase [Ruegeria haliotis]